MYTTYLESRAYGRETYRYATEEEARNGFFRLYASAVACRRVDNLGRSLFGDMGDVEIDRFSVEQHPELTMTYRDWLYTLDEEALTKERERWENLNDYV